MRLLNLLKSQIVQSWNPYRWAYTNSATSIRSWYATALVSFPSQMEGYSPPAWESFWSTTVRKWRPGPTACRTSILFVSSILNYSVIYFPEEGYPTSLTSVKFDGENICKQVTVWGLHRLTSLTSLWINDGIPDWQSFPLAFKNINYQTRLSRRKIYHSIRIWYL